MITTFIDLATHFSPWIGVDLDLLLTTFAAIFI